MSVVVLLGVPKYCSHTGRTERTQVIVRLADNRDLVELGNFPMPGNPLPIISELLGIAGCRERLPNVQEKSLSRKVYASGSIVRASLLRYTTFRALNLHP